MIRCSAAEQSILRAWAKTFSDTLHAADARALGRSFATLARREGATTLIDVATLTGAMGVALPLPASWVERYRLGGVNGEQQLEELFDQVVQQQRSKTGHVQLPKPVQLRTLGTITERRIG